jgi:outer membrane lipase/esterase
MIVHPASMLKQFTAFLILLAAALTGAHAGNYSNIYFFGDSLTDSGVYRPLLSNAYDHFSTNPGTVWSQNLGAAYGLAVSPAYAAQPKTNPLAFSLIASGNNFATGSARINLATRTSPASTLIPPVSVQVTQMLARGPLDPQALYVISGGHNDVFAQIASGSDTAAAAGIIAAANELTTQVTRLESAGARHLIVIGIMDITKTPIASMRTYTPDPALLGQLVSAFNETLESGLAGKKLLYFDTGKLLNAVIANPAAYGFTNVKDAATPESLGHAPDPGKETGYLFADIRHPSAPFHKILSDWIYTALEDGSRAGLRPPLPPGRSGGQ